MLTSPEEVRQVLLNARGKSQAVERAAFRRLVAVSARHEPGTVQHACWEMVHTVEQLRRDNGRKVWRMKHMRPKIDRDGEIAALEYCVMRETDGFREVLDYGMPELTAEAIVLRHREHFSAEALKRARERLEQAGVDLGETAR